MYDFILMCFIHSQSLPNFLDLPKDLFQIEVKTNWRWMACFCFRPFKTGYSSEKLCCPFLRILSYKRQKGKR